MTETVVIYLAFYLDVPKDNVNGELNETWIHLGRFTSVASEPLYYST